MRAGLLNEVIEILTPTIVKNNYGEETTTWISKCKTRASVLHKAGGKRISNDDIIVDYTKTIQVRYYIDVDEYDRILYDGNLYQILDIESDRHLQCKTLNIKQLHE